eukprot:171029-Pyramimonas_sp.AAC.1
MHPPPCPAARSGRVLMHGQSDAFVTRDVRTSLHQAVEQPPPRHQTERENGTAECMATPEVTDRCI